MAFTRKFLIEQGVPEDKVDVILAERNRTMNDYILKSDVDQQIKDAVAEAQKNNTVDLNTIPEYVDLQGQVKMMKTLNTADFDVVKKPYKDIVWGKLDHSEKHAPYDQQLKALAEQMPDLFVEVKSEDEEQKPQFAGETKGSIPSGKEAPSFADYWKFKKQEEIN